MLTLLNMRKIIMVFIMAIFFLPTLSVQASSTADCMVQVQDVGGSNEATNISKMLQNCHTSGISPG